MPAIWNAASWSAHLPTWVLAGAPLHAWNVKGHGVIFGGGDKTPGSDTISCLIFQILVSVSVFVLMEMTFQLLYVSLLSTLIQKGKPCLCSSLVSSLSVESAQGPSPEMPPAGVEPGGF